MKLLPLALLLLPGCFLPALDLSLGSHDGGLGDSGITRTGKPNLMFLIDKSGSMGFAANDQVAPCTPGCNTAGQPACAAGCPTRLQEVQRAMATFLSYKATIAWVGMAIYPTASIGDSCGATTAADIRVPLDPKPTDLDVDVAASAAAVNSQLQALAIGGGTPTGDSLRFLGGYPPLNDPTREQFVVLLTDGVPNCNPINVNSCTNPTACKCTLGAAANCGTTLAAAYCTQGCLDVTYTVSQVVELRRKNIKTIVIGFGADLAFGDGPDSLNAMAQAGGFARACPNATDAECGANNTCETATRLCTRQYYQAGSAPELAAALADMTIAIKGP